MTSAAAVFVCLVVLALVQGFGAPAFATVVASDAIDATLPFLGMLVVARFLARRYPARAVLVTRVHVVMQALIATMGFGWWWVEPHAMLTSLTGGSLAAMAWQAVAGAAFGAVLALVAERVEGPEVLREVGLGSWIVFLLGGGRVYRAFDHIEAGTRIAVALAIVAAVLALAVGAYLLLRRRGRIAAAVPALAPAAACIALLVASRAGGPAAPSSRDSVVLVVIDTLRADIADGGMNGAPPAMPELARIASAGTRFTQAVSPAPWTLPATVSLLSGWNPHRHGYGASASTWEVTRGDPAALYLASALRDAGFLTSAFVNNPWLRPWYGFDAGFYALRPYHGRAIDGVALALDWLHDHDTEPSFTLLHLMDPHWPYDAPPGFGEERRACEVCDSLYDVQFRATSDADRDEVRRRYSAEVQYTDTVLGRFYDTLASTGALDHRWLIVTADHGEEFWEHGEFLHGHSLYDELLRVPLVVVPPKSDASARRGVRVDSQVRLEDVAATVLDITGVDPGRARDGQSLLGLVAGGKDDAPRVSVAGFVKSPDDLSYAVRRPPWKAVFAEPGSWRLRLYDLAADAGETRSLLFDPSLPPLRQLFLAQQYKDLAAEPQKLGIPVARKRIESTGLEPDASTKQNLQSLGYVH